MADLKSYSYDDFQALKAELKTMTVEQLNEVQQEAAKTYREVKTTVDNMSENHSDLESTAQLSSRIYNLSEEAKKQVHETKRQKLSNRASLFGADLDQAVDHLNEAKEQFRAAVKDDSEQDIRERYEALKAAEYEKEYAEAKRDTFKDIMRDFQTGIETVMFR